MHLTNPLDVDVSIVIKGVTYSIPAGGTVEVPKEAAEKWMLTHQFLRCKEAIVTPPYQGNNQVVQPVESASSPAPRKRAAKE